MVGLSRDVESLNHLVEGLVQVLHGRAAEAEPGWPGLIERRFHLVYSHFEVAKRRSAAYGELIVSRYGEGLIVPG